MADLDDMEAIQQLKYRYFRALDGKDWDLLSTTLTEDASAAYDSGRYSFEGRDAILTFLRDALGSHRVVSMHHGHHPEITLDGADEARGIWYLEDKVVFLDTGLTIQGAAFYHDDYVRRDGLWKIRSTGYERTFEQIETAREPLQMRTRFDPA